MAAAGRAVLLVALLFAVIAAVASLPFEVSLGGSGGFELGRGTDISARTVEVIRFSCNDPCKERNSSGDCVRLRKCRRRKGRPQMLQ